MAELSGIHWLIVLVVVLLLFGNRLPSVMRSLGRGMTEFKKGMKGVSDVNPSTWSPLPKDPNGPAPPSGQPGPEQRVSPEELRVSQDQVQSLLLQVHSTKRRLKQCQRSIRLGRLLHWYLHSVLLLRGKLVGVWVPGGILIGTCLTWAVATILASAIGAGWRSVALSGLLSGLCAFVASLHWLWLPSRETLRTRVQAIERRLPPLRHEAVQLRASLERYRAALTEAMQTYSRLHRIANSRRNRLRSVNWRALRGVPFEEFLKAVFEELGYRVETTKTSGDQGTDLLLYGREGCKIAVQAKGYEGSVGNSAVQEALAGMAFYRCHRCAVVTNSTFTTSARELAARIGCALIDRDQIPALIDGHIPL